MKKLFWMTFAVFCLMLFSLTASAACSKEKEGLTFTGTDYTCERCGYAGEMGEDKYDILSLYDFNITGHKVTVRFGLNIDCVQCGYGFARAERDAVTFISDKGCTEPFYKVLICTENLLNLKVTVTGDFGHRPAEEITCQKKGVCTRCGVTFGEFAEHIYQDYAVTKPYTCKENSYETGKCKWCDATDTREIEYTKRHVFANYISNNDATCQYDGTETSKCKFAEEVGCTETRTRVIEDSKVPCQMGEYVSNNNATCQTNCTETRECIWKNLGCDYSETREIPNSKADHKDGVYENYIEATCTENALYIVHCKWADLGCTYSEIREITESYYGHSFKRAWQDVSCTEAEGYVYTCRECGHSEMRSVEQKALGHYYGEWEYRKDGVHRASCVREGCGKVSDKPCALLEVTDGENVKTLCPVCGRFGEDEFEIMYGVKFMPLEKGALPKRGERLIRVMEAPVEGSLFGFTFGYEYFGEMVPFNGKVAVEMKLNGRIDEKFCLVRVDTEAATETAPRGETWENVDFTFEDGILKFEADRTALYLLLPAAR